MNFHSPVQKPKHRSRLRKTLGREYFILRRKAEWLLGKKSFARVADDQSFPHSIIRHKSMLLRPLRGVDMHLQHNKVTNLRIAISHLDKVLIRPGETFSIWRLVGRPTKAKGYLEGMTLHNGQVLSDTGGGLCQLGNLLYWMALHSPLAVSERWRHSYDVFPDINRSIPFGCGATLSYNYIDLQLENRTEDEFQIRLWLDESHLHGEITCPRDLRMHYEIVEKDHAIRQEWWGGYSRHNSIWKKITSLDDQSEREEWVASNNAIMMYNPLLDPPSDFRT